MDLAVVAVICLAAIAITAIAAASYYAMQVSHLRDVSAAAYQLAGFVLDAQTQEPDWDEFDAGCELLLDVLADPDGDAANALVAKKPSESYIQTLVTVHQEG